MQVDLVVTAGGTAEGVAGGAEDWEAGTAAATEAGGWEGEPVAGSEAAGSEAGREAGLEAEGSEEAGWEAAGWEAEGSAAAGPAAEMEEGVEAVGWVEEEERPACTGCRRPRMPPAGSRHRHRHQTKEVNPAVCFAGNYSEVNSGNTRCCQMSHRSRSPLCQAISAPQYQRHQADRRPVRTCMAATQLDTSPGSLQKRRRHHHNRPQSQIHCPRPRIRCKMNQPHHRRPDPKGSGESGKKGRQAKSRRLLLCSFQ